MISDQYSCQKLLYQTDISTSSRQNIVTKTCPKYLLTRYQTDCTKKRYIDQAKSNNVNKNTLFYLVCQCLV